MTQWAARKWVPILSNTRALAYTFPSLQKMFPRNLMRQSLDDVSLLGSLANSAPRWDFWMIVICDVTMEQKGGEPPPPPVYLGYSCDSKDNKYPTFSPQALCLHTHKINLLKVQFLVSGFPQGLFMLFIGAQHKFIRSSVLFASTILFKKLNVKK